MHKTTAVLQPVWTDCPTLCLYLTRSCVTHEKYRLDFRYTDSVRATVKVSIIKAPLSDTVYHAECSVD